MRARAVMVAVVPRRNRLRAALAAAVTASALAVAGGARVPAHEIADTAASPQTVRAPLPAGAVARVSETIVTQAEYDRWRAIGVAGEGTPRTLQDRVELRKDVMRYLLLAVWVRLEAAEHGVGVTDAEADRAFARTKRESFDGERGYRAFLKRSGMTDADARAQSRFNSEETKLRRHVTRRARTQAGRRRLEKRYARVLQRKWRAQTVCGKRYKAGECSRLVATLPAP